MARMKAATKKKKRVGGFDRSKLNPNFMGNQKTSKDKVNGWAFDFDNPDSGSAQMGMPDSAMIGDDSDMQRVLAESLAESQGAPTNDAANTAQKSDSNATNAEESKDNPPSSDKQQAEEGDAEEKRKANKKELIREIETKNAELLEKYL